MQQTNEYDTWMEDEIICPRCDKKMDLNAEYSMSFTTSKPNWLKQWQKYNRRQISISEYRRSKSGVTKWT